MCKAALANNGWWNSWKNTELSKNTKEDTAASCRNQISKCKAVNATPAMAVAVAGGFLPGLGEGPGGHGAGP